MASPIADLSYRSYDGPLNPPSARWWVIAKVHTLKAFRNRFYWLFVGLSGWYYLVILTVIFIMQMVSSNATDLASGAGVTGSSEIVRQIQFIDRFLWKNQFLHGFSFGQLTYLIIALLVGAGAVANDNRANALLVYLSKPCTKLDYVVGKFFGVWIPLVTAMAVPSLVFFLYGMMSYRQHGFALYAGAFPAVLGAMAMAAALHTSILLGISSLMKQGRIAGILYGALYMITNIFTVMILVFWLQAVPGSRRELGSSVVVDRNPFLQPAFYSSIDGLNIGMAKSLLNVDGGNAFGMPPDPLTVVPAPNGFAVFWIMSAICAFWLYIFWRRVRAVEVVN
ncbi:MAG: ABC transporter permease subunit [Fimbriimonadaceae bacterium]|nr:ABC transporter permease subunit [Fimbriimonadaceae bacterium]